MKVGKASTSKVLSTKNPNIPNLESKSEFPDLKLSKYKLRSGQAHLTSSQQKQEIITKKNMDDVNVLTFAQMQFGSR